MTLALGAEMLLLARGAASRADAIATRERGIRPVPASSAFRDVIRWQAETRRGGRPDPPSTRAGIGKCALAGVDGCHTLARECSAS